MTTTGPPTVYPTLPKEEWTITVCFGRKPSAVKSVTREPSVLIRGMVDAPRSISLLGWLVCANSITASLSRVASRTASKLDGGARSAIAQTDDLLAGSPHRQG